MYRSLKNDNNTFKAGFNIFFLQKYPEVIQIFTREQDNDNMNIIKSLVLFSHLSFDLERDYFGLLSNDELIRVKPLEGAQNIDLCVKLAYKKKC